MDFLKVVYFNCLDNYCFAHNYKDKFLIIALSEEFFLIKVIKRVSTTFRVPIRIFEP